MTTPTSVDTAGAQEPVSDPKRAAAAGKHESSARKRSAASARAAAPDFTGRAKLIQVVKTPLGFFTLVVLIVEAIFGALVAATSGTDRTIIILAMTGLVFALVGIVAYYAYWKPEALSGLRGPEDDEPERLPRIDEVRVENVFCGVTEEYAHLGFSGDVDIIRSQFSESVVEEHKLTVDNLQDHLTNKKFAIVHLLAFVDPKTGAVRLAQGKEMSAEGLAALVKLCGARMVFLATCDSLMLAAQLARTTSVVAASGKVETERFQNWERTFYRMLGQGRPLSEAYDFARATSDAPLVLIMKEDLKLVAV